MLDFQDRGSEGLLGEICWLFLVILTLATSNVISESASTCDFGHSWQLYTAAPQEYQAASIMTQHPTHNFKVLSKPPIALSY